MIRFFSQVCLKNKSLLHGYVQKLVLHCLLILVSKILHAKKEWHTDPQTSKIRGDKNIQKMSDFLEKMDALAEEE